MIANCIYYAFSKVLFSIVFLLMLHFFTVTSCFFHVSRVTPTDHPFTSQNVFPYLYTTLVPLLFRAIIFLLFTCVLARVLFFFLLIAWYMHFCVDCSHFDLFPQCAIIFLLFKCVLARGSIFFLLIAWYMHFCVGLLIYCVCF